jgi:hypothetical protein
MVLLFMARNKSYMSEEPIIKNISQHIQLDDGEIDYFLSLLQPKTIKRKEYLLRPNEVCKYESFIIKGCLRTYTIDNDGLEHIVMFAVEDWWKIQHCCKFQNPIWRSYIKVYPSLNDFSGSYFRMHLLPSSNASIKIFPLLQKNATCIL